MNFYYTFGTAEQFPYQRGWVKVVADSHEEANKKFRTRFPDVNAGTLNCAFTYKEERFLKTSMAQGKYPEEICHEVIE